MTSPNTFAPIPVHVDREEVVCPNCTEPMQRIERKGWMRLLPKSRLYRCFYCYRIYLSFLGKLF